MSVKHHSGRALLIATIVTACACSNAPKARVFFVEPQDGATVKSPVHLKFGVENYQVAAVPQGTVDTARAGMGHYHVAVDSDCLSAGTPIQKAAPWVHFGTGNSEIDMQLPPGKHKLTLEMGDDMHRAVEGLCTSISVNVTE
jgi:uncharacterized protein involved in high-affinity Fe2+ transport